MLDAVAKRDRRRQARRRLKARYLARLRDRPARIRVRYRVSAEHARLLRRWLGGEGHCDFCSCQLCRDTRIALGEHRKPRRGYAIDTFDRPCCDGFRTDTVYYSIDDVYYCPRCCAWFAAADWSEPSYAKFDWSKIPH